MAFPFFLDWLVKTLSVEIRPKTKGEETGFINYGGGGGGGGGEGGGTKSNRRKLSSKKKREKKKRSLEAVLPRSQVKKLPQQEN